MALTAGFLLAVPAAAQADTPDYTPTDCGELVTALGDATDGQTVQLGGTFTCDGEAPAVSGGSTDPITLDLAGNKLTIKNVPNGHAGLGVPSGTALTIDDSSGAGELHATGGSGGAGIGGGDYGAGGTITITGGDIHATGGFDGAGIGGGYGYRAGGSGGDVTITGGEVHATGVDYGAGIGGGYYGDGGDVTIEAGATVTATGDTSKGASAIGAGYRGTGFGSLTTAGTLILPTGSLLDVPTGIAVDNSGTIENHGTLQGGGSIDNSGAITGDGTIDDTLHGNAGGLKVSVNSFKLTADPNGGTITGPPSQLYVYAATSADAGAGWLADAHRAGYTFTGWQTSASGGDMVTDGTDLHTLLGDGPQDVTLYAAYETTPPTPPTPPPNSCPILSSATNPGHSLTQLFCGSL